MYILVLNGVNLNMTGIRSRDVYGSETLEQINTFISDYARSIGVRCDFFQTNFEGELVEKLHAARKTYDGVVLNAGAWTHYSYAVRDAVEAIDIPVIEAHMSDITRREEFRRFSVLSEVCEATVMGKGKNSYTEALKILKERYNEK